MSGCFTNMMHLKFTHVVVCISTSYLFIRSLWPDIDQESLKTGLAAGWSQARPQQSSLMDHSVTEVSGLSLGTQAAPWRAACGKELRPPANSQTSEPSWKQVLQPQASLPMTAALPYIIATSWENSSQYSMVLK